MRALSKGNRQKVQLIAALATRADLLLLDEPTSGLDPLMEVAFRESLHEAKERGQAVFLSSHILSEVEALCDRVGILRPGRLVDEGTLSQLRHLGAQTIEVTFEGAPPPLPALEGVKATSAGPNTLQFEVNGEIGPLMRARLQDAIEEQAAKLRRTGIHVDMDLRGLGADLPGEVQTVLFRVVQESLTNVARHSGAKGASVVVSAREGRLRLMVEDDGRGFDTTAPTGRLGLAGIRERVELLGGRLRIESSPDGGTAVVVDLKTV